MINCTGTTRLYYHVPAAGEKKYSISQAAVKKNNCNAQPARVTAKKRPISPLALAYRMGGYTKIFWSFHQNEQKGGLR